MAGWRFMIGRAKKPRMSDDARFVRVLKQTVPRVCKEWCITGGHEARQQMCYWIKLRSPLISECLSHLVEENQLQTLLEF